MNRQQKSTAAAIAAQAAGTDVQTLAPVPTKAERLAARAAAQIAKADAAVAAKLAKDTAAAQAKLDRAEAAQRDADAEVASLKAMADANYELDGGTMSETTSDAEFAAMIAEHKTAKRAWAFHMKIHAARQEQVDMEPATGYAGPMLALRQRLKAGIYTKAANGQPSCGDEVALTLGSLEPAEVIRACMIAMDLAVNPYLHLNLGQQSMNLRNKLRGALKHEKFGMGVLREAVEVVTEGRTPAAE